MSINKIRINQSPAKGFGASLGINYKRIFQSKKTTFNFGVRVFRIEELTQKRYFPVIGSSEDTLTSFKEQTTLVDFPFRFDFNLYTGKSFKAYVSVGLLYSSVARQRITQYFYNSSTEELVSEMPKENYKPYYHNFVGIIFACGGEFRIRPKLGVSLEVVSTGRGVLEYAEDSGFGTFGLHVGIYRRFGPNSTADYY